MNNDNNANLKVLEGTVWYWWEESLKKQMSTSHLHHLSSYSAHTIYIHRHFELLLCNFYSHLYILFHYLIKGYYKIENIHSLPSYVYPRNDWIAKALLVHFGVTNTLCLPQSLWIQVWRCTRREVCIWQKVESFTCATFRWKGNWLQNISGVFLLFKLRVIPMTSSLEFLIYPLTYQLIPEFIFIHSWEHIAWIFPSITLSFL